jgi:hypothetical protein
VSAQQHFMLRRARDDGQEPFTKTQQPQPAKPIQGLEEHNDSLEADTAGQPENLQTAPLTDFG